MQLATGHQSLVAHNDPAGVSLGVCSLKSIIETIKVTFRLAARWQAVRLSYGDAFFGCLIALKCIRTNAPPHSIVHYDDHLSLLLALPPPLAHSAPLLAPSLNRHLFNDIQMIKSP